MKKGKSVSPVVATVVILVVVLVVALLWMKFSAPSNAGGNGMGMSMGNVDPSKMTPELSKSIKENLAAAAKKNAGEKTQ